MTGLLGGLLERSEHRQRQVQFTIMDAQGSMELSPADLIGGARRYAALFEGTGCRPGDMVFIALQTGADLYYAFLGALWVGCVPSMMPFPSVKQDPELFWRSHDALFRHLGGGPLLTYPENVAAVQQNTLTNLMHVVTPADATGLSESTPYPWQADEVCCVQHSSGTTGLKKGVALTHATIAQQIASYAAAAGITPTDTIVSWLPFYHDMGFVTNLLLPLLVGNPVVLTSPFEWLRRPTLLFDLIERHRGAYCWLPNFAFHHLVRVADDAQRRDLSSMKAFVNCSEPCKVETFTLFGNRFRSWGVRPEQLQISYGMAEAVFAITQTKMGCVATARPVPRTGIPTDGRTPDPACSLQQVSSVGPPIAGIEVSIADGPVGEIMIRGSFVFSGYHRRSGTVLSADGWFKTGDIGFLEAGEVHVLGRRNDLIIALGRNFFAHELEAIVGVTGVKPGRMVALGVFNPDIGTEQVVIVAELDGTVAEESVRREIRRALEATVALVPARILLVQPGWLVKSTSGKISRSGNLEKYLAMGQQTEAAA